MASSPDRSLSPSLSSSREGAPTLSVISPAYNEAANLPLLYDRLVSVLDGVGIDWEWIVVDDHSSDATFAKVVDLARRDGRVRGVRFSRNFGSHTALTCGLREARGRCAVLMAADLQDPPESVPQLLDQWRMGYHVVWAVRRTREGERASTLRFSRLYYFLMRKVVGIREMPATGADFFVIDRRIIDAFLQFREGNSSVLAQITWMGFRQTAVLYDKQARVHGRSGWSIPKKLKLVVDSIVSFTYLPIRVMTCLGLGTAFTGLIYALVVIFNAMLGHPVQGWSSLMVVTLIIGGVQLLMMGVLGEYLWRALDEARQRPRYLIEDSTDTSVPDRFARHCETEGGAQ